jgi:hypothetical protein
MELPRYAQWRWVPEEERKLEERSPVCSQQWPHLKTFLCFSKSIREWKTFLRLIGTWFLLGRFVCVLHALSGGWRDKVASGLLLLKDLQKTSA